MRSCSCQVEEIKNPAGLIKKGDRSGPLYWPKRGAPVESPGTMYNLYILEPSSPVGAIKIPAGMRRNGDRSGPQCWVEGRR